MHSNNFTSAPNTNELQFELPFADTTPPRYEEAVLLQPPPPYTEVDAALMPLRANYYYCWT
ncbi:hypothetical protein [Candidatus Ichthyocystis hellenicum]|uniref:hypothetical protein n=1 Tax=Candidatus Ichthyocystis hellenicum TaxID=1561003 RepID=UPI0011129461|nr:hypothetical protein [Candidatus Ichthyocystis hellenicum]